MANGPIQRSTPVVLKKLRYQHVGKDLIDALEIGIRWSFRRRCCGPSLNPTLMSFTTPCLGPEQLKAPSLDRRSRTNGEIKAKDAYKGCQERSGRRTKKGETSVTSNAFVHLAKQAATKVMMWIQRPPPQTLNNCLMLAKIMGTDESRSMLIKITRAPQLELISKSTKESPARIKKAIKGEMSRCSRRRYAGYRKMRSLPPTSVFCRTTRV